MYYVSIVNVEKGIEVSGAFTFENEARKWYDLQVQLDSESTTTLYDSDRKTIIAQNGG